MLAFGYSMDWQHLAPTEFLVSSEVLHIHTYIHTHIHTYIHTHIHTHIHTVLTGRNLSGDMSHALISDKGH